MKKPLNERGEKKERKNIVSDSALHEEIYRAVEMMKRVKKSNAVQFENPPESQRMPSYLMPDAIILCQTSN
jgi:hypothetical protein